MHYIPGGARHRDGTLARLQILIDHQKAYGFSKWAVVERRSSGILGDCGLQYLDGGPEIELGFHIGRSYWGHGYATRLRRLVLLGRALIVAIRLSRSLTQPTPDPSACWRRSACAGQAPGHT